MRRPLATLAFTFAAALAFASFGHAQSRTKQEIEKEYSPTPSRRCRATPFQCCSTRPWARWPTATSYFKPTNG